MAHVADGLPALDGIVECPVENGGRHLLLELARHVAHGLQQAVELESVFRRREDHRSVIEEEQTVLHPLAELGEGGEAFLPVIPIAMLALTGLDFLFAGLADIVGHQIPLVDHDDAGASLLHDHVGDLLVLLGDAVHRVDHQNGDVASGDGILGALHREVLDGVVDPACFADTGRVHQHVLLATGLGHHLERHIDGIAGGPRDRADDHPLGSGQLVDDGRFADVRASHDGQALRPGGSAGRQRFPCFALGPSLAGCVRFGLGLVTNRDRRFPPGQESDRGVHQIFDTASVDRRGRVDPLETQRRELARTGGGLVIVGLVDHHQHGLLDGTQLLGHLDIERNDALLDIDHEQDHVGRLDGQIHLLQRGSRDHILGLLASQETDAPRVDQCVRPTMPFGLGHHSITGDSGLIVHDGDAATDDSIEER